MFMKDIFLEECYELTFGTIFKNRKHKARLSNSETWFEDKSEVVWTYKLFSGGHLFVSIK